MPKKQVNIALIGCGTVGMGVVKILSANLNLLEQKTGVPLRLVWVCDKIKRSLPPSGKHKPRWTSRWQDVISDPGVDIVVELMGGHEPARTVILEAMKAGKQVATANKALLANYWDEIFSAAIQSKTLLYFEAAVGGGIPVIQGLNEGLAANRIEKIFGILNGTTNYIMDRMSKEGMTFAEALKEAQRAGFAEANPTFDVEGIDAAHKLSILASLASGTWIGLSDIYREGIADLDVWDVRFAQEKLGFITKLLGVVEFKKDKFSARVHPSLISSRHPFANVTREYNAVFVHGDAVGDVMFYGKGAGQMAAASAVVSDVLYLARHVANGTAGRLPYVSYRNTLRYQSIPFQKIEYRHYLRFTTADKPGVLSQIAGVLGKNRVSIAAVHQEDWESALDSFARPSSGVPIVIVTHEAPEGAVREALKTIDRLSVIKRKTVHLRIVAGA